MRAGHARAVALLLEAGADPSVRNNRREFARGLAQAAGRQDLVELIDTQARGGKRFFGLF